MGGEAGHEAVELARRNFEAFNAGDDAAFWRLQHPDCLIVTDPGWPGGGEFRGLAAYRRFMAQFTEAFAEVRFAPEGEPEAIGSLAHLRGRWVGTGASSGIETASPPFSVVFCPREHLIGEARLFYEERDALRFAHERAAAVPGAKPGGGA